MGSGIKEFLFIGLPVTSSLKASLDKCNPALQFYFKDNDPLYLQSATIRGEPHLGKTIEPGSSVSELQDIARSVRSMIMKVAPDYRVTEASIKIFVQTLIGV